MKTTLLSLLFLFTLPLSAQEETDTIFATIGPPKLMIGINGGISFIRPEVMNKQIEYYNVAFGSSVPLLRNSPLFSVWLDIRPKNIVNYISLRGEMITNSRDFSISIPGTNNAGVLTNLMTVDVTTTYRVYPLSINAGSYLPKTSTKVEIGFVYALGYVTEKGTIANGGNYTTEIEGDGYGFRIGVQSYLPFTATMGLTLDINYRYLKIDNYSNNRGQGLKDYDVNYSAISTQIGWAFVF